MTFSPAFKRYAPCLGVAALALVLLAPAPLYELEDDGEYFSTGSILLHGLPHGDVGWSLPLEPLSRAIIGQAFPGALPFWPHALAMLGLAFCFVLACALAGRKAALLGLLAAGLFSGQFYAVMRTDPEMLLYCCAVAATAAALALRTSSFTLFWSAALGFCTGMTLLIRSPFFVFPFLLCLVEWKKLRLSRRPLMHVLLVCLLPFLLLAPWTRLTRALHGSGTPFEVLRADDNIITAALGLVMTTEGDTYKLAGIRRDADVTVWAAGEILRHPLRYLHGLLERVWLLFAWFPLLWALGLAAFIRHRASPAMRALALLCAYYAAIHLVMTIEPRYFLPLRPLLAAAVLALFLAPGRRGPAAPGKPEKTLFLLALLPLAALTLAALALLWQYPARAAQAESRLPQLLKAYPEDARLFSYAHDYYLAAGQPALADAALKRAMFLQPENLRLAQNYAFTLFGRGVDVSPLARYSGYGGSATAGRYLLPGYLLLQSSALCGGGSYLEAEKRLALARSYWNGGFILFRQAKGPYELGLLRVFYERNNGLLDAEMAAIASHVRGDDARSALLECFSRLEPEDKWLSWKAAEQRYGALLESGNGGHKP